MFPRVSRKFWNRIGDELRFQMETVLFLNRNISFCLLLAYFLSYFCLIKPCILYIYKTKRSTVQLKSVSVIFVFRQKDDTFYPLNISNICLYSPQSGSLRKKRVRASYNE